MEIAKCQMQFISCYLRFDEVSWKFKIVSYVLSKNMEAGVETTFDFSLCAVSL